MRIGIDATFNPTGGSLGHLKEFIIGLAEVYPKADIVLFLKKENIDLIGKDIVKLCSIKISYICSYGDFSRLIWVQIFLPILGIYNTLDVLFCPGNFSPIIKTTKVKSQWIGTIGPFVDEVIRSFKTKDKFRLFINKLLILISARTSNVVIHESGFSSELFKKKYRFKSQNQYLIECGKDSYFYPCMNKNITNTSLSGITSEDLLCVSHLYPYKNIECLIRAFAKLKYSFNYKNKLYVAGNIESEHYFRSLKSLVCELNLDKSIIFTGKVSKEELRYAYSICKLFVFPSHAESSGYILIEAMSCAAAIIASNKTAIPWTCGDSALYFDSDDPQELFNLIKSVIWNNVDLSNMKKRSIKRSSVMIDYKTAVTEYLNIVNNLN